MPNMLKIKFICESCRNMNKHRTEKQPVMEIEYTVFSEAVNHLIQMSQYGDTHYMDVVIEDAGNQTI